MKLSVPHQDYCQGRAARLSNNTTLLGNNSLVEQEDFTGQSSQSNQQFAICFVDTSQFLTS